MFTALKIQTHLTTTTVPVSESVYEMCMVYILHGIVIMIISKRNKVTSNAGIEYIGYWAEKCAHTHTLALHRWYWLWSIYFLCDVLCINWKLIQEHSIKEYVVFRFALFLRLLLSSKSLDCALEKKPIFFASFPCCFRSLIHIRLFILLYYSWCFSPYRFQHIVKTHFRIHSDNEIYLNGTINYFARNMHERK